MYARPVQQVFVGALLESRSGQRSIELTQKGGERLYRLGQASALLADLLRRAGLTTADLSFTELDAAVRLYSDDPEEFSALAEKDSHAEWLEVMPRAAVLARWGSKGARAADHV